MKKSLHLLSIALFLYSGTAICQDASLSFDGNDYIEVPEIPEVLGSNARTVDAWIKVPYDDFNTEQVLVQWGVDASATKWTVRLHKKEEGVMVLRVEHGAGATFGTTLLNDSEWHHVAVALAQDAPLSDAKLYVDGVEETYGQQGGDVCNTDTGVVFIGKANSKVSDGYKPIPVRHWKGLMDELRIWKIALSAEQILAFKDSTLCPDDNPDLVAYFKLNEGEGTDAIDATGNYNGVLGGNPDSTNLQPTWVTEGAPVEVKACEATYINATNRQDQVSIFPNPARDIIEINSEIQIESVSVYDITGKIMLKNIDAGFNHVNVSSLEPGLYVVRIKAAGSSDVYNTKLLKK